MNSKNLFCLLIFLFCQSISFSQTEKLKKLSQAVQSEVNNMGYSLLGNWYLQADKLPYTVEVYLHGGNDYLFSAYQETKTPDIGYTLTRVYKTGDTKIIGDSFDDGVVQSMNVNGAENSKLQTYRLTFENKSGSSRNSMVTISYKSKDNATTDHEKNSAENYYTGAEMKNWLGLIYNSPKTIKKETIEDIKENEQNVSIPKELTLRANNIVSGLRNNGYKTLSIWHVQSKKLPLINEVYLHGGNTYAFISIEERGSSELFFSLAKVEGESATTIGESDHNKEYRSLYIDATKHSDKKTCQIKLRSPSKDNSMFIIAYRSKDNDTKDGSQNHAENYYSGQKAEDWNALAKNRTEDRRILKREGAVQSTLVKVNIENVRSKKVVWTGAVSDIYSISDSYVSYGLFTPDDQVTHIIENMNTGKQYVIESNEPVFLKNDTTAYRQSDGQRFNFMTNEPIEREVKWNTYFEIFIVKSKTVEKAMNNKVEQPGLYKLFKTYDSFLALNHGYYVYNNQLFDKTHKQVDFPSLSKASKESFFYVLDDSPRTYGRDLFFLPRFGQIDEDVFFIHTEDGYIELNTKTGEQKKSKIKPSHTTKNLKKDRTDRRILLERGIMYEEGTYTKTDTKYDLVSYFYNNYSKRPFNFEDGFSLEIDYSLYGFEGRYFKGYEYEDEEYNNVLSPSHLRAVFIGYNYKDEFRLF